MSDRWKIYKAVSGYWIVVAPNLVTWSRSATHEAAIRSLDRGLLYWAGGLIA